MEPGKPDSFCRSVQADRLPEFQQSAGSRFPASYLQQASSGPSESRSEAEVQDAVAARKVQKADREKLRRDRLNEQFVELGKALDPDRPKNDKATILNDAIQMVKDLTAHVNRLKAEYASLSEESRELTQEKNELREEKSALKSDIDNLLVQYQQRVRVVYPWATMDPSMMMGAPPYSYPVPVPVPSGPIPLHPSLQPFPFFRNQNPGSVSNPFPVFPQYSPPVSSSVDHSLAPYAPSVHPQSTNRNQTPSKQESRNKSSERHVESLAERSCASNDVATDLELKTPGSALPSSSCDPGPEQGKLAEARKGKRCLSPRKGVGVAESCSSKCSSSRSRQDSSSNSVGDGSIANG
ncbi:transcription factor bHLH121 [Nymphaea colorata]|nr:transcription factor bHLH121 [Nymphaea colorata]